MSQLGCLLIFLILHVPVSNCKFTPRNNTMSKCLTFDANCTTGPNITYPFWFPNRCQSYKGYPDLGVSCRYGVPTIKLPDGPDTFYIKSINYSDKTFDILSADLEKTSNSCPTPLNNVTLRNDTLGYAAGTTFFRIFYNCSSEPIFYPKPDPIPCLNNSYWAPNSSWEDHEEGDCDSVVTYPVLQAAIRRVYSSPYMALKDGFKVVWRPGDDCNKCENSGGHCGFTYESHFCECPDGLKHSGYCNNTNNNAVTGSPSAIPTTHNRTATNGTGPITAGHSSNLRSLKIILAVLGTLGGSAIILCFLNRSKRSFFFWRKETAGNHTVELFLMNYGSLAPKRYRYFYIKRMTNNFKDKLGEGGYGSVFKGKLSDGRMVAVKLLSKSQGNGEQFMNEVATIGRTNHVNIVSLLGYCSEGSKRALVYEFMSNGSLEKFIYIEKTRTIEHLGWEKLYQIAHGIAKGLEYLHLGCTTRIIHLDIKPHNILLDQDFFPKISDFGLAKLCPKRESNISMHAARGTIGYIAPELCCRNIGGVSYKSDVYSYGMMVLEMVGGRKNINTEVENASEIYFPHWIYKRLEQRLDMGLGQVDMAEEGIARKMIMVGLWCIQTDPTIRPSMSRVVEMLEGSIDLIEFPPKPYFGSPSKIHD